MKRLLPLLLIAASLSGCGLRPLYAGGSEGAVAQSLRDIEVAPIEGKGGWLVRNAINDRLAAVPTASPRYRLVVKLDDEITGFGVRSDDAVTRERRTLRARYQLIELSGKTVVLDATAGSDAGIDVTSSEYATIAAENTALERLAQTVADQIISRLALYATRGANDQ
ncbi:LPS assembly lipoprotein LptE [Rhizorhapis sp. SPR117]|jgi:LPS-assembly lipoprotein|uniref:LPS assembly lipoprotein LptE n=1 Tax=Rhizorhapis sp. SPR117 TaxID=2912611 RepID=UPI001EFF75A3|nr:LPS assembly lipoprotein LptE [Rhizorhapis sp. SPR117]